MAGGWGRYLAEWMVQTVVVISAALWWGVMTFIVLPVQLIKGFVSAQKPNEFSHILITGASSGIGAELARSYAKSGVKLVLTARRAEKLAAVKAECEAKGAEVKTLSLDVNDKDKMNEMLQATDKQWPFDLVIANAGVEEAVFIKNNKDPLELDTQWGVTATNVVGVVNTVAPLMNRMKNDGKGQIVIMSSISSVFPRGSPGWMAYHASKIWARAYGVSLRGTLAPFGVGVTTVCPGYTETDMLDDVKNMSATDKANVEATKALPVEVMVARTKEAIAYNVPVFFVPFGVSVVVSNVLAMNVVPPSLRRWIKLE